MAEQHISGLHHVQLGDVPDPDKNLMRRQPIAVGLEKWQMQSVRDEAKRRFKP